MRRSVLINCWIAYVSGATTMHLNNNDCVLSFHHLPEIVNSQVFKEYLSGPLRSACVALGGNYDPEFTVGSRNTNYNNERVVHLECGSDGNVFASIYYPKNWHNQYPSLETDEEQVCVSLWHRHQFLSNLIAFVNSDAPTQLEFHAMQVEDESNGEVQIFSDAAPIHQIINHV